MKQKLLLMVLTLGMISINVSAQTKKLGSKTTTQTNVKQKNASNVSKELKVEECGFEWYKVGKNGKWGAEDKNGKVLIPIEYGRIEYQCTSGTGFGFRVSNNGYNGYYSPKGECVIPCSRHYYIINADRNSSVGTYYWGWTKKDGPLFFCNESGEEVCQIEGYGLAEPKYENGKFFWKICLNTSDKNSWCIMDGNGKQIFGPAEYIFCEVDGTVKGEFDGRYKRLGNLSAITTTTNPFAKVVKQGITYTSSSNSSSSSTASSNNSSSNNNSGGGTTTIVVEHQYTPQPVQEWQACFGCGGMGTMGCDNCGGSGTKYIGDRLHRCSRCNGRGIIPCNICYGSKGKYVTVYR